MSYVPATTVKDGVTLNLSNVDWQVIGTDLLGDTLSPASYPNHEASLKKIVEGISYNNAVRYFGV